MRILEKIEVETYAGCRSGESPRAFLFHGTRHAVREVTGRWREGGPERDSPLLDYFRVRTEEGGEFLLRYDPSRGEWRLCVRVSCSGN